MAATLYLLPNLLGDSSLEVSLPAANIAVARGLKHFMVESEKAARKFLKLNGIMPPFEGITMHVIDSKMRKQDIEDIFTALNGEDAGIVSDAGCPGIADPGSNMIRYAHTKGYLVKPMVGPSSILLALMGSGFYGQNFTFHGYLPADRNARLQKIRELENLTFTNGDTHLFIETPYRNVPLMADLIMYCRPNVYLSVAVDLTLATEQIITARIQEWRHITIDLKNRPAVFSLWAEKGKARK